MQVRNRKRGEISSHTYTTPSNEYSLTHSSHLFHSPMHPPTCPCSLSVDFSSLMLTSSLTRETICVAVAWSCTRSHAQVRNRQHTHNTRTHIHTAPTHKHRPTCLASLLWMSSYVGIKLSKDVHEHTQHNQPTIDLPTKPTRLQSHAKLLQEIVDIRLVVLVPCDDRILRANTHVTDMNESRSQVILNIYCHIYVCNSYDMPEAELTLSNVTSGASTVC